MKKIVLIFSIVFILSCSNNSENELPVNPSNVLLKKIVTNEDGIIYETTFIYNGKKLIKALSSRQRIEFTYDGDKIIKIEWYIDPQNPNTITQYVDFEYFPDGKLKRYKKYIAAAETVDFVYNSDGTVDYNYVADYNNYYSFHGKIILQNNEVVQIDVISLNDIDHTYFYTYDNKRHPFENVVGYDKLGLFNVFHFDIHTSGFSSNLGNNHNHISFFELSTPNQTYTNVLEYNSNNFPIQINYANNLKDSLFYEIIN